MCQNVDSVLRKEWEIGISAIKTHLLMNLEVSVLGAVTISAQEYLTFIT